MRLEAIMTRDVVAVAPEAALKDVAAILVEHGISGVPVWEDDLTVVGVVSEADILRMEQGCSTEMPRPIAWLVRKLDGEIDKVAAVTARAAMSSPAVTARPTQHAADAARTMVEHRIKRLPIVTDGRLVGIVTRADLVRAFIRPDEEVAREITEDVLSRTLLLEPGQVELHVEDGRVTVSGSIRSADDAHTLLRCIRRTPGVVSVTSDLSWQTPSRRRDGAVSHWP